MNRSEVLQILKDRGIEVGIGGCGCCSSPWVTIKIDGEAVYEEDGSLYSSELEESNGTTDG